MTAKKAAEATAGRTEGAAKALRQPESEKKTKRQTDGAGKTMRQTDGAPEKKKRTARAKSVETELAGVGGADNIEAGGVEDAGQGAARLTQDDVIQDYRRVYDRCMEGESKGFDAKGALSALDQISKILGLDTPAKTADSEDGRVILTLSDGVGDRGD